ncbi:unannotated protein [freshwater metagenome]|uniref:Unannotated protein n=1 Tax=freshwater metagenome TaxID=449393 RepID=A0A6J7J6H2_9ZZZZ
MFRGSSRHDGCHEQRDRLGSATADVAHPSAPLAATRTRGGCSSRYRLPIRRRPRTDPGRIRRVHPLRRHRNRAVPGGVAGPQPRRRLRLGGRIHGGPRAQLRFDDEDRRRGGRVGDRTVDTRSGRCGTRRIRRDLSRGDARRTVVASPALPRAAAVPANSGIHPAAVRTDALRLVHHLRGAVVRRAIPAAAVPVRAVHPVHDAAQELRADIADNTAGIGIRYCTDRRPHQEHTCRKYFCHCRSDHTPGRDTSVVGPIGSGTVCVGPPRTGRHLPTGTDRT